MEKFLILDRDGIVNVDYGYVSSIEDFKFQPNFRDFLKETTLLGYQTVIFTNQSGIARGYFTEMKFHKLMSWMNETLIKDGLPAIRYWYCPHYLGGSKTFFSIECECRKPKVGMLKAIDKYKSIDRNTSVLMGDKKTDILAGKRFKIKNLILVEHDENGFILPRCFEDTLNLMKKISC